MSLKKITLGPGIFDQMIRMITITDNYLLLVYSKIIMMTVNVLIKLTVIMLRGSSLSNFLFCN